MQHTWPRGRQRCAEHLCRTSVRGGAPSHAEHTAPGAPKLCRTPLCRTSACGGTQSRAEHMAPGAPGRTHGARVAKVVQNTFVQNECLWRRAKPCKTHGAGGGVQNTWRRENTCAERALGEASRAVQNTWRRGAMQNTWRRRRHSFAEHVCTERALAEAHHAVQNTWRRGLGNTWRQGRHSCAEHLCAE